MKTQLMGFFTPLIIYTCITLLHYFLPGKWYKGYVKDHKSGKELRYRLNGRSVLLGAILIWALLGYKDMVSYDWLYQVRWYSLAGAFVIGLVFSLLMVLPHTSTGRSALADFFFGRLENPQFQGGRIDAKMWLYLVGAVMLELNVLSFAAHHYLTFGSLSAGVILCTVMLTYFVFDYLTFEKVHLYTYDLFAERVGLKLGWGCLVFYPYFYLVALWATVDLDPVDQPLWLNIIFVIIFFSGWILARGANMQKYYFKLDPEKIFLGIRPETITNGSKTLLVNGFWGRSRHINYLGEILMATGIALSVGHPGIWWVWLYPLYYVALLFPRQLDDDKRCSEKYGELWMKYKAKVKFRIIPYVY